jgi:hypothetical protein
MLTDPPLAYIGVCKGNARRDGVTVQVARLPVNVPVSDHPKGPDLRMMPPNIRRPRSVKMQATMNVRSQGL